MGTPAGQPARAAGAGNHRQTAPGHVYIPDYFPAHCLREYAPAITHLPGNFYRLAGAGTGMPPAVGVLHKRRRSERDCDRPRRA